MFRSDSHNKIFFIGIGGISMSALAMILKNKGCDVSGYDRSSGPQTKMLEEAGISVTYDLDCPLPPNTDAVVYTAAVDGAHPLMISAADSGIEIISRADLLGALASEYKNSIGIAGTHGKSTTSGMLSSIFEYSKDCDSTYVVGAVLPFIGAAFKAGSDENFIFEACEYKNSFHSFYPAVSVILNIDLDHTDFFKNIENMKNSFRRYLENTSKAAVLNYDSPNVREISDASDKDIYYYSIYSDKADFYAKNIVYNNGLPVFDVHSKGSFMQKIKLSIPGEHNISNAMAAFTAAYISGLAPGEIAYGLNNFKGVARRFEYICDINGGRLYDDYAHHPDEITATLNSARAITKGRLIAVFQPHTFSRLSFFFDEFKNSLTLADIAVITEVYSAREPADNTVNGEKLAGTLDNSIYIKEFTDIQDYILKNVGQGDTCILLNAGDLYKICENIKKLLTN